LFTTNKLGHKRKVLNLRSNIKENILWDFFLHISLRRKENNSTPTTSFLMLETKHENSKATFASSSSKLSKIAKSISFLNYRLMDKEEFNASFNNQ
jgi:hypothetical protein